MNSDNLLNPNIIFEIAFFILHVHMYMQAFLCMCVSCSHTHVMTEFNNIITIKAKDIILQLSDLAI
jgi:hypothetical protein